MTVLGGNMLCVRTILGAGLVALTLATPIGAQAQSLADALTSAYRNSPQLKAEQANLRATDEGVADAVSTFRPSLSLSASGTATQRFATGTTTLSASLALSSELLLWDGGGNQLALDVARHTVDAGRQTLKDLEQTVLLNAVIAFMDIHLDTTFLQLAENNRAVLEQQLKAANDRFEVGEIRRTDVSQTEAFLAGAESTVALRRGTLDITRETYHVATGTYPGSLQAPPPPPRLPASLPAAISLAMKNHPVLERARILSKIAEVNILRAEAAMKPRISVSSSLSDTSTSTDSLSVTLGVTMPISAGGALTAAHRRARALDEKARADVQRTAQLVAQSVTQSWRQLEIARASITARAKGVRASRVALRGIREEASLGARTTLDVLDAEQALVQAEADLAEARRNENVAVYSLLSAMGLLTADHLGLAVARYDPEANYKKVSTAPGPEAAERKRLLDGIFKRAGRK
jgi:outer membrane protein